MSVSTTTPERIDRLRTALTGHPAGRTLIAELLPRDVVSAGVSTGVDWSDWQQFSQWPQSY